MKNNKRNKRTKVFAAALCFCILCFSMVLSHADKTSAAEQTISVNNGDRLTVQVHPGDTGTIVPNADSITADDLPDDAADGSEPENNGSDEENGGSDLGETDSREIMYTYDLVLSGDTQYIQLDPSGTFQILAPGEADVEITGRNSQGLTVFSAAVHFEILPDMTNVTLEKNSLNVYLVPSYSYGDSVMYDDTEYDINVNSETVLSGDMPGVNLSTKVSNKKVRVTASLSDNVLHLSIYGTKKCTAKATVSIGGKEFQIKLSLKPVSISDNALLFEKGQTKQLKLKGFSGTIKWSSSDKTIAAVSKSGVVKGRKTGNAIITAEIEGKKIGCAVSVTTAAIKKICERACYIAANWEYSLDKRFMDGYYDCSALVWKAYKEYGGINFGNPHYPATTATASAWCKQNNRVIKGGYTKKKAADMKLYPGDIVFKSSDLKNPYGTTYHVEMFTGYACVGYNKKGNPTTTTLWAARGAGYGAANGSIWARPIKQ